MKDDIVFSFVIAVYNVGKYITDAIDSLIAQTIGFDFIQIVLIDDGSADQSPAICDQYARRYPDNIKVIHQANAGVSSARNKGLQYVCGKYVSFMDADDKLTPFTCEHVKAFFDKHKNEVDLVAIPMFFFEGASGDHVLNVKFKRGTRVINIEKEWNLPQLSMSSAFVKAEALKNLRFDTRLRHLEDMKIVQQILLSKRAYGVVSNARYWYRRRAASDGKRSAVQSAAYRRTWYMDTLAYAEEELFSDVLKKEGYIPKYIQYAVMYDLQWRLTMEEIPPGVLSSDEQIAYKDMMSRVMRMIDDSVIDAQRHMYSEHKIRAKLIKYNGDITISFLGKEAFAFVHNGREIIKAANISVRLEFLRRTGEELQLDFCVLMPNMKCRQKFGFYCKLGGRRLDLMALHDQVVVHSIDEPILTAKYYRCAIPLDSIAADGSGLRFYIECNKVSVALHKLAFGRFFPLSNEYMSTYWYTSGFAVSSSRKTYLWIEPTSLSRRIGREKAFLCELWKKNHLGARKAVFVRLFVYLLRLLWKKRPFWLISDRAMVAGDNGEAFFRYMVEKHPEQKVYFCINSGGVPYKAMRKIGPVLKRSGYMYKLRFLLADWIVSSQAEEQVTNPFFGYSDSYKDMMANRRYVFLGHGITQNDLSGWIGRHKKDITGIVAASSREAEAFSSADYGYTADNVWLVGLPRYDRLYHDERKQILIMPTWRRELMSSIDTKTGMWTLAEGFENSEYYRFYNRLINDGRLLDAAEGMGYKIVFYPHLNLMPFITLFGQDSRVLFAEPGLSYRTAFAQGDVLVTDYSSVAFDFAYLRKPIVYSQFDKDAFYARTSVIKPGYFNYERDGFGPIIKNVDDLVQELIDLMRRKCRISDFYKKRIDDFFAYSDAENSRRVYEKMMATPSFRS